ncbi:MAG: 2-keto-4-pentenoate hydratase [Ilumatobacter sp.]
MQLTEAQHREVATDLVNAEETKVWTEPLSLRYDDVDIEDAYAVGQMVTDMKVANGRVIKGHKVGLTSKAMREATNMHEPDYGTMFDNWFLDEGTQVSMSMLNKPAVEVELVFVLKENLGGPSVNAADVIRATDFVTPAIEIVDSRYAKRGSKLVIDSISDAASCGFVMLGANQVSLGDIDVRHVGGALYKNGEVVESGTAAAVMGNPIASVAWLARKLGEFGVEMQAGHSILSGSFIRIHPMRAGESFVADFGPLGQISFGVIE